MEDNAASGGQYFHDPVYFPIRMNGNPAVSITTGGVSNVNSTAAYNITPDTFRMEIQNTNAGRVFHHGGTAKMTAEI